jgi:hypothetical protein
MLTLFSEEQHDDQMLYEILRCIKALTTSDVGKAALRAHHPRPFTGLSELLFSEKKPGELPCRQIIIELWLFHFELFPKQSAPGRPSAIRFDGPTLDVPVFIRGLLVNKTNKADNMPDFMAAAQRPRIFSDWVKELGDVCRDYFWVMCHGRNMLWALHEVNEKLVERPVAPGGATGGVEFEAMGYVVSFLMRLGSSADRPDNSVPSAQRSCASYSREQPCRRSQVAQRPPVLGS